MRRRSLFTLLLIVLAAAIAFSGAAAQVVPCPTFPPCPADAICDPVPCPNPDLPTWGVFTNPDWLVVEYHRVNVTIDDQIARTNVDMQFVNRGDGALAEGTFIFPLPPGASVDSLVMYINEIPIEARIMEADEARAYYDEIVRSYRDPALLEYIGTNAIQANVFPIPAGEKRRITLSYTQVLAADGGLIEYEYPLDVTRLTSRRAVEQMSISVQMTGDETLGSIYSPSHDIAVSRQGDTGFRVGFERTQFAADRDFSLFYSVSSESISLNALSYREGANEDGFFMLLVQPPLEMPDVPVAAQDVILVVDQSGSMQGDKWSQAQDAARYVLDNLGAEDRFNAILFSTGWRVYANELVPASDASDAASWISGQYAEGGTDINGALTTALEMVDLERPTTILFITDGLPSEGEMQTDRILENLDAVAPDNARIFAFGVGDDVDTFLLDGITRAFDGTSSYVRPSERIDEEVASLWNKVSAPVLQDATLSIEGVTVDTLYPSLPIDLFGGTQLTLVGRYREGMEDARITLTGMLNGESVSYVYEGFNFRERGGGEPFIAQLWATRRIGDLLNSIRLNGESRELVDSIVSLSVRYGIITPYTSFLIDENDILTQSGRDRAVADLEAEAQTLANQSFGAAAVGAADIAAGLSEAAAPIMQIAATPSPMATMGAGGANATGNVDPGMPPAPQQNAVQTVEGRTFVQQNGVWTDTTFEPDTMTTQKVVFLSDAYFDLLSEIPALAPFFAIGDQVIVVLDGVAYEVTLE
ncbi:MAG: VWA domain-containing protein [Pleurocapsa minor GSE-CHR-MK-17-07R]|jgi:Ca-activated chloride channel family protein|nr:VWA domain-containing protein [Pleurocapsa minor GSE-CHR-MK 17-07R]